MIKIKNGNMLFELPKIRIYQKNKKFVNKYALLSLVILLTGISICCYIVFYLDGLGLSYNDARSHLDIGRRVVEGLKTGMAQLGSVWLPLPHLLTSFTVWNDFMWHSGLSGAIQSMVSFVATGYLVYKFLEKLGVSLFPRIVGVFVFAANLNVLYMQSTAMTELMLIATMTAGVYELLLWQKSNNLLNLIKSAFWIMLSTLNRYDGWFLFVFVCFLVVVLTWRARGKKAAEGMFFLFFTLSGFGIALWFLWNQLIFHDALYFVFGPYSAHAQQQQLAGAGVLATKGNMLLSAKVYFYALAYNEYFPILLLGLFGAIAFFVNKNIKTNIKIAMTALFAPLFFNILALYLGFSVLFVQGISGNTWFNVRYGILMAPSIAIFVGYLVHRFKDLRYLFIGLILFNIFFALSNGDAVTIDDARVGSSQKNVSEVSGWLHKNALNNSGFVLIAAASHDAIIFSSGLPMSRFIHEGTGVYWDSATKDPMHWARYIIMRTNDVSDQTFKLVGKNPEFINDYTLVHSFPFADIYQLKPQYLSHLETKPILAQIKD